ncbi:MAG TPA: c-type cytochrome domain-containing protein [Isosphaeraceae bacterium]|nr:c-type cytochrome domain-containing protein [Isosphaeraceae bacterium]
MAAGLALAFGLAPAWVASVRGQDAKAGATAKKAQARPAPKKKAATKKGSKPAKGAEMPAADAPQATATPAVADDGRLKFSRDIAPILLANCAGCHNAEQRKGKFDLTSYKKLMDGSEQEKVIVPGKPEESKLVELVETRVMPKGAQRKLSDAAIDTITNWVKQGAVLDAGVDANATLAKVAVKPEDLRKSALAKMTLDQRDKQTEQVARERWKKADPKAAPELTAGPHVLLFANLPRARAAQAIKALETSYTTLQRLLGPAAEPWASGPEKISLYVFNDAKTYVEFVRTVETREVEAGVEGHGNLAVEAPYVAVIDPLNGRDDPFLGKRPPRPKKGEEATGPVRTLPGLLAEKFAVAAVERSKGKPPRYLSLGLGAFVASAFEPRGTYERRLRVEAAQQYALGWMTKANQALGDDLDEEKLRAVGFSLVEWLEAAFRPLFQPFVVSMLEGKEKLDDTLHALWGDLTRREDFLQLWGGWIAQSYPKGR